MLCYLKILFSAHYIITTERFKYLQVSSIITAFSTNSPLGPTLPAGTSATAPGTVSQNPQLLTVKVHVYSQETSKRGAEMSQGVRNGQPWHVVHTMQVEESMYKISGLKDRSKFSSGPRKWPCRLNEQEKLEPCLLLNLSNMRQPLCLYKRETIASYSYVYIYNIEVVFKRKENVVQFKMSIKIIVTSILLIYI